MAVRSYANAALPQRLTAALTAASVTVPVASTAGYPLTPFLLAFERGTANAEVALCTAKTANTFTVTRGFDGTTALPHAIATVVEHCSAAIDFAEANAHVNSPHFDPTLIDAAGDLIVGLADNVSTRIAVGTTADYALVADPTSPVKMKWADIGAGAWVPYTPTWGAGTSGTTVVGNGTLGGRYKKIGRTCHFYFTLALGTTTYGAYGYWYFGYPPGCTPLEGPPNLTQFGQAYINKADVAMAGTSVLGGSGITILTPDNSPVSVANAYVQSGPTGVPSGWGNGDFLRVWGTMETAA